MNIHKKKHGSTDKIWQLVMSMHAKFIGENLRNINKIESRKDNLNNKKAIHLKVEKKHK
jgi:hypothetical protein